MATKKPLSGVMLEPKWTRGAVARLDRTAQPGKGQRKATTRVEVPANLDPASPSDNPAVDISSLLPASLGGARVTLHGTFVTDAGEIVK